MKTPFSLIFTIYIVVVLTTSWASSKNSGGSSNKNESHFAEPENDYIDIKKYPPPNILLGRTIYEWYKLRKIWVNRVMNVLRMNGLKMDIKQIETQWDGKFDDIIPVLRQRRFFDPEYSSSRSKRKVIPGFEYKWRLPIRYNFDENLNATLKVTIMEAIAHWEEETCIRFVHDVHSEGDYLKFISPGGVGCASFVGKIGGQQNVFLDTGCEFVTIVAHEIGHSVGFFHEQSRPNRDDYLLINMSAINILAASNFHIDEGIDYGSPYDHGSIMHYGPKAFLQKGLVGPVIRTTDPLMQTTIGSGSELSFYDARSANRFYCSDNCSDAPNLDCQNMGYLDPNNCSICKCPNILSGRLCDEVEPSKGSTL
ncbi:unnamed protein product [Gordionus sp. m RMFG-2023]